MSVWFFFTGFFPRAKAFSFVHLFFYSDVFTTPLLDTFRLFRHFFLTVNFNIAK